MAFYFVLTWLFGFVGLSFLTILNGIFIKTIEN